MAMPSPLDEQFEDADALFMPYGQRGRIVAQHDAVELEYAAVRKHVGLLDCPHRGLLRLTGADRVDFLHRMLTCEVRNLDAGVAVRGFLLDAKGRITADVLVAHFDDCSLVDTDIHQIAELAAEFDKLLFTEDVQVADLSRSHHRLSLHGPKAAQVREWWHALESRPAEAWDYAFDECGSPGSRGESPGIHIWMPTDAMTIVGERETAMLETFSLRPVGWLAYNMARIEAGTPLFNVDFGPGNQPHETGILDSTVDFNKGCYRGQEIVARIQSRAHPARILVAFRGESSLPVAGSEIYASNEPDAAVVGAVTSSTPAPLLSQSPIGFAMVKWDHHEPGTTLYTPAEGATAAVTVHDGLRLLPKTD